MEPISALSLVSSCASITRICISVSKTLTDLADKYKHAELSILSLAEECNTIQLAWSRIERWASENVDRIDDYGELHERLQKSIHTGNLVISSLEKDLKNLQRAKESNNFLRRTRVVWNENIMRDHQHRLRGQVGALTLLLEVIRLPTKSDRNELLSVKGSVFNAADDSVRAIVPSRQSRASSFRRSIDSYRSTELRYKPLSFENDLFSSFVYKRNFRVPRMFQNPGKGKSKERRPEERSRGFSQGQASEKGIEPIALDEINHNKTKYSLTTTAEAMLELVKNIRSPFLRRRARLEAQSRMALEFVPTLEGISELQGY